MPAIFVHQIFYDEASRQTLDPAFVPLDNTSNDRPDWFEFWPIRRYLHATTLEENAWYGFVSPKFHSKTGVDGAYVRHLIEKVSDRSDVVLLSPGWEQIAYFRNVFEQGEIWHPGLAEACQGFASHVGVSADLSAMVTHSLSCAFSNYVVATARYWRAWLKFADALYDYVEQGAGRALATGTSYGAGHAPLKTFVQERISALVLATADFRVISYDPSAFAPLLSQFIDQPETRRMLRTCDELKQLYCAKNDPKYLERYYDLRYRIPLRRPFPDISPAPPKS